MGSVVAGAPSPARSGAVKPGARVITRPSSDGTVEPSAAWIAAIWVSSPTTTGRWLSAPASRRSASTTCAPSAAAACSVHRPSAAAVSPVATSVYSVVVASKCTPAGSALTTRTRSPTIVPPAATMPHTTAVPDPPTGPNAGSARSSAAGRRVLPEAQRRSPRPDPTAEGAGTNAVPDATTRSAIAPRTNCSTWALNASVVAPAGRRATRAWRPTASLRTRKGTMPAPSGPSAAAEISGTGSVACTTSGAHAGGSQPSCDAGAHADSARTAAARAATIHRALIAGCLPADRRWRTGRPPVQRPRPARPAR